MHKYYFLRQMVQFIKSLVNAQIRGWNSFIGIGFVVSSCLLGGAFALLHSQEQEGDLSNVLNAESNAKFLAAKALTLGQKSTVERQGPDHGIAEDEEVEHENGVLTEQAALQESEHDQVTSRASQNESLDTHVEGLGEWVRIMGQDSSDELTLDSLVGELKEIGFSPVLENKGNDIAGKRIELNALRINGQSVFAQYFLDETGETVFDAVSVHLPSKPGALKPTLQRVENSFGLDSGQRKGNSSVAIYSLGDRHQTLSVYYDTQLGVTVMTLEQTECENALL